MRIIERSVYRGPHHYSATPMVRIMVDLEDLEKRPTNTVSGFTDRLLDVLPTLRNHGCSGHRPGGFVQRLRAGTWMGHVIEHAALELQTLAGHPVTRGKTRSVAGEPGIYNILYAYRDESVGLAAGRLAFELIATLLPAELATIDGLALMPTFDSERAPRAGDARISSLAALTRLASRASLGPTTQSLVDAARRRRVPVTLAGDGSLVRLGYGSRQKHVRASMTSETSHLAVQLAGDKARAKRALADANIPVPDGIVVATPAAAIDAATQLGYPVVTKPLDGNHGRGITLGILDDDGTRNGFDLAARHSRRVLVEKQLTGRDYRVLVVGGHVVAVAERVPAHVIGDGQHTIRDLIDHVNQDPRRGVGHGTVLTRLTIDDHVIRVLDQQNLTPDSVPAAGRVVMVRDTANLSTGGTAIDRTDEIHPVNRALAERAATTIGLDIAGLDLLAPDISLPLTETGGAIIEVNAAPGFRMHLAPSHGTPRDVATPVIDMLFPRPTASRIPITSVTGTNGKTTVVRMIGHILERRGLTVGMTTTIGQHIGGHLVRAGDASGPKSARAVLADPAVDAAVLETARGGMLREGLAYDRADVGIVLNIAADHLGLKHVDTLPKMAAVKSLVVRQVKRRGTSILNADDPLTVRMARRSGGRVAYFTARSRAELPTALELHIIGGGLIGTIENTGDEQLLTLHRGDETIELLTASEIPATLDGTASFNTQNALAAALAAFAQGVPATTIASALREFESTFEQNPGRLNITTAPGFATILDYAHNPAALSALGDAIEGLRHQHDRVIAVVSIPGDRRDEDMLEMGRLSARLFDEVIFRERPDGRGRPAGDVVNLLSVGAIGAGMPANRIRRIADEAAAMDAALRSASPRDLVVLMPTNVADTWQQVLTFRDALEDEPPVPSAAESRDELSEQSA